MQTDELNRRLVHNYIGQLSNRDVPHRRILLSFCGVPGSGKTTLAKMLTRDLRAQYIRHDDIRAMIRYEGYEPSKMSMGPISTIVANTILANDANKFIIIDAGQDRQWERFFAHAKEWKAQPIIIRLNVSKELLQERLSRRDSKTTNHRRNLELFIEQFENCKKHVVADIELVADYNYDEVLARVKELVS